MTTSEQSAREQIDADPAKAGWVVQDTDEANLYSGRGVALREFPLKQGHGFADYLLYVDAKAAGVIEAKRSGTTLTGVETQAAKYSAGLPDALPAHQRPLPRAPGPSRRTSRPAAGANRGAPWRKAEPDGWA